MFKKHLSLKSSLASCGPQYSGIHPLSFASGSFSVTYPGIKVFSKQILNFDDCSIVDLFSTGLLKALPALLTLSPCFSNSSTN